MKERKNETFVYEGFGFPIKLINCPMKKVFGEWVLDINLSKLQLDMVKELIHKPVPLTGLELRFIRKFLELSTTEFGKLVGVSHPAVLKWEKEQVHINPTTEIYIRLYVSEHLKVKDREFRDLYQQISIDHLLKHKNDKQIPLAIEIGNDSLLAV
jgi:DNA-binding transcriptional regulator YiaG